MNASHSVRAARCALAGLTALLAGACVPAAAPTPAPIFDPQACAEEALRRSPDPAIVKEAADRFSRECEALGEVSSCSLLGVLLELGLGVHADHARARTLYRSACDAGNQRACGNLGGLLLAGAVPGAPPDGALALLQRGCDAGYGRPCAHLGRIYNEGTLVPRAPVVAASWFERACQRGAATACVGLADLIERGDVAAAPAHGLELLVVACAHGDEEGCARLARHPPPPRPSPIVLGSRER
jgi:TPR repeat protein